MDSSDIVKLMPFATLLGIDITSASAEAVTATLEHRADLCTTADILHGGALMSLADTTGAVCAFLNLPAGARTSTLESKTNMIRAVKEGTVTATSTPVHVGRSTIVLQTEVRDDTGRLVSLTTQTQTVLS
jgi:1,4-dihydroxy-2-naphthoyl-CoA hydrolase